jgi:pentatricopeptide repeat protein
MWQLAVGLFMQMAVQQLVPDVISCNALISCCEKGLQWQKALHFFSSMSLQSVKPDVVSYNAVLSACQKRLQWEPGC